MKKEYTLTYNQILLYIAIIGVSILYIISIFKTHWSNFRICRCGWETVFFAISFVLGAILLGLTIWKIIKWEEDSWKYKVTFKNPFYKVSIEDPDHPNHKDYMDFIRQHKKDNYL